jgi:hypothetical protein
MMCHEAGVEAVWGGWWRCANGQSCAGCAGEAEVGRGLRGHSCLVVQPAVKGAGLRALQRSRRGGEGFGEFGWPNAAKAWTGRRHASHWVLWGAQWW